MIKAINWILFTMYMAQCLILFVLVTMDLYYL